MNLIHLYPQLIPYKNFTLKFLWRLTFIWLTLMIGLRHEIGVDWNVYCFYVERLDGVNFGEIWRQQDPAYEFLNWLGANVGGGIYLVNLIAALIFCWGLFTFCSKQPRPWLALLVSTPYLIVVVAMGYTRQGVAIGLIMLAITYLLNGRTFWFFAIAILATMFHRSAIIIMPLAFLVMGRLLMLVNITVMFFLILLLNNSLSGLVFQYSSEEYQSSGTTIRVIMNIVSAIIFLIFSKRFSLDKASHKLWLWISLSSFFLMLLLINSPSTTLVDRLALYWIPLQIFVLSRLPDALGKPGGKNEFWTICTIIYSGTVMFIWLYFAEHAYAWVPYSSYLFEVF